MQPSSHVAPPSILSVVPLTSAVGVLLIIRYNDTPHWTFPPGGRLLFTRWTLESSLLQPLLQLLEACCPRSSVTANGRTGRQSCSAMSNNGLIRPLSRFLIEGTGSGGVHVLQAFIHVLLGHAVQIEATARPEGFIHFHPRL